MTVSQLVTDARGYVTTVLSPAQTALQSALTAIGQIGYTQLTYNPVALPAAPVLPALLAAPTLAPVSLDLPTEPPNTLLFQDITPIEVGTAPTFTGTAPTLTMPTLPAALDAFQLTVPAVNTNLVFPEPPSVLLNPLVDAPVFVERTAPVKPQVLLPVFTAQAPTDVPVAPTDLQGSFTRAFSGIGPQMVATLDGQVDAMLAKFNPNFKPAMAAIEAQLAKYLAGGTGMNSAVETQIYERSRAKAEAEGKRVGDAWKGAADAGWTMPTGAVLSGIRTARQAAADINAAGARDIVVQAMEYEQKNLQFAVTTSSNLRQTMLSAALNYHQNLVQINGQAMEYAKTVLSSILELYNAQVKLYEVKLDGYKAEGQVFEVKLKSAMAGIELYRQEIAALEALTNIDRAKVEVYKARVEALMVYANVYRAQIEAVQGRASLEKLKIDLFGAQVQAYGAHVQAKNGEYQGYTAAINGQEAQVKVFEAQVQAANTAMQGYRTKIEALAEVLRGQVATNQARGEQFKTVMSGYSTVVEARGKVATTKLENQRQQVIAFQASSQAVVANAQVRNEYYRTTGEIAVKNAALSIEAIVKSAELARGYGAAIAAVHTANATIYGNLAGSAMAGMNTLAAETVAT